MAERRKQRRLEHLLGWVGLFLIGSIGAAYRIREWVAGGSAFENSGIWRRRRMACHGVEPPHHLRSLQARSGQRTTVRRRFGDLVDAEGAVRIEYLAARPGRLILKSELLDALWPDVFVADGALKACILEIRRALGDDAHTPRFIETAHRRGYRFIGDVSHGSAAVSPPPAGAPPAAPAVPHGPIQYARSGDVNIAYQVCGTGPVDLVFVMGWVSHLEYFWKEPSFARFLGRLASFSRLILFDKRGTGLSDRVGDLPTLNSAWTTCARCSMRWARGAPCSSASPRADRCAACLRQRIRARPKR